MVSIKNHDENVEASSHILGLFNDVKEEALKDTANVLCTLERVA